MDVVTLASARDHNGTLLLAFEEVGDRAAAEGLRGALLEADVPDDVEEPDAWYDHQLVGLRVARSGRDAAGRGGRGRASARAGPARRPPPRTAPARLVPFVAALVPTVDVAAGVVVVDAPPGLLDDVE